MARRLGDAARSERGDLLLYCNGIDYEAQDDIGSYLEFECLPTGGWGYETLPIGARYLRTLGKPVLNMTGRFHKSWGDFGGIRTEPSLEYDLRYGMANAMRTTIGDHFHPRGDINQPVFDLYKRLYDRLQRYEPWLAEARAVADIGLVWPTPYPGYKYLSPRGRELYNRFWKAIKGGTRLLCELRQQFDVVTTFSDWSGYRLLVLPDFVTLDAEVASRVRAHLDRGGAILSSGWSGLDPERRDFVFGEWGLRYDGDDPYDPAYFRPAPRLAEGLPDMPITFYQRGAAVAALDGTEVLAEIIAPYYNRHWDGYGEDAQVPLKQLLANLLPSVLPAPLVRAPGLPSFARATVTEQPGRRMVHLLSYCPERRGDRVDMIEEPIELRDVALALREDVPVRSVYLAPDREDLPFEVRDGYVQTVVPRVPGHAVVVFEE
ncbi:MAG: beta-galactosidase trimerization domain-containing protein [Armatimonadetes bacterium]|nr:beta-galactosidase trimerization domain-containing protein [Armatimonadota bacterium]